MTYALDKFEVKSSLKVPERFASVKKWQDANEHLLALVPERWKALPPAHQWEAIRIVRKRQPPEMPEGFEPEYWAFLCRVTPPLDFEAATEVLASVSAGLAGRRYESEDDFMRSGGWTELFMEQLKPSVAGERNRAQKENRDDVAS
jgi:hypothetical protein